MPFACSAIGLLVLVGLSGAAQVGTLWTFATLHGKSQVVVIANAVTTTDTGHKVAHPGLGNFPAVEMSTQLEVLAVLKTDSRVDPFEGGRIVLHYYRHDWEQWHADHPTVPGEPPPGVVNTGSALQIGSRSGPYLLFLIRTARGFEPVSGHTFPTESVFDLRKRGRPPG